MKPRARAVLPTPESPSIDTLKRKEPPPPLADILNQVYYVWCVCGAHKLQCGQHSNLWPLRAPRVNRSDQVQQGQKGYHVGARECSSSSKF